MFLYDSIVPAFFMENPKKEKYISHNFSKKVTIVR